nr:cellulase family glycosylhydrolase [Burkholderia thailandensis]
MLGGEIIEIIKQNPQNPTQAINNYMSGVAAMNVRWVRIHLDWSAIQPASTWIFASDPNPGQSSGLTWGATDIVVRAARNYGIRILGVITSTPRWAVNSRCPSDYLQSTDGAYTLCAPNLTPYTNFARAAAKHYSSDSYGGKIDAWEIWNEPNCGPNFIPHDPLLYTRLLKSAYPAIKQANPAAAVYAGGSSGCLTSPNNGTGALPSTGVAGLVSRRTPATPRPLNGAARLAGRHVRERRARVLRRSRAPPHCHSDDWQLPGDQCPSATVNSVYPDYSNPFNIMWHTFPSPSYGWPSPTGKTFASYTGTSLRDLMNANGDGTKPIVITEFGVATTASDGATDFTGRLGGDAQQYTDANFQTIAPAYLTQANQAREYKALIAWIANQPYGQYGPVLRVLLLGHGAVVAV